MNEALESTRSGLNALDTLPAAGPSVTSGATAVCSSVQTFGALTINRPAHTVTVNDSDVPLSPAEYRVLLVLTDHPRQVIDYQTLVR